MQEICQTPLSFEVILKQVFDHYGLTLDHGQYVLVGSTLRSYLSYLADQGKLECVPTENMLLWKTIS